MSVENAGGYLATRSKIRVSDLLEAKWRGERWPMLTSYDAISAKIFDLAKIPVLLVGDSAAQVVFGYKSTIPVTLDELIPLARAVASSCERALVVGDMPFGSYQESPQVALRNATRFMKEARVHAVKLEGGSEMVEHVKLLTSSGIPVMAHIGLTPQAEHALSGYKIQGRGEESKAALLNDALRLKEAGAFACVVELVPTYVGFELQAKLDIPIVGIGAGPGTDAQVLVWTDMVGFSRPKGLGDGYLGEASDEAETSTRGKSSARPSSTALPPPPPPPSSSSSNRLELSRVPKFVKRYANMSEILFEAAINFANDVRSGRYPAAEHSYV